jgi:hypothetical protein
MSSKNCRVSRYGSPVSTNLRIAPGTAARRSINASETKIELRASGILICQRRWEVDPEHPAARLARRRAFRIWQNLQGDGKRGLDKVGR